jgi:hypothetical protein
MSIRLERRFSAGLTFNTSYTWGKAIHDFDVISPDSRNLHMSRGPADIDNRNRFVTSFLYALPFGKGAGFEGEILGGWQIAGALVSRSGQHFTPTLSSDISNTASGTDRPNAIGDTRISSPDPRIGWWNKAGLSMPAQYTFGNAASGILIGPDFNNLDLSLQKVTKVRESKSVEFRVEVFNVANHPNFASPNTKFDTPLFGTLSSALDARQVQLGLKYIF